ncbi:helix-turn-helix domain-containing protein [Nocardiopsis potens]|uniref:helix-turn-helix domain-containing protein n=1 Tax=Nocardiopsis potens TaxID=1246458 RepID=UPI000349F0AA|nr:helix-turn-helix transcriptional regulator [Nocardiopsis potens]
MRRVHSPTVRLRRLAGELRRRREHAGHQITDAAKTLGWSGTKLGRFEAAETRRIKSADLDALLDLYKVDDPAEREALHQLARDAKDRGWWSQYKGVFTDQLPDFEAEASAIRTFEPQVIPGLLQTPEYAEAVIRGGQAHDDEAITARVAARMERQQILNRHDPPEYWAIIDEAALRRPIGTPEVMSAQLRHLVRMATREGVTVQVLPFAAGSHAANMGALVIMDFAEPLDPSIAYTETYAASLILERPEEVARFTRVFAHASASALPGAESVAFIRDVAQSLGSSADE